MKPEDKPKKLFSFDGVPVLTTEDLLIEIVAAFMHDQWSHWMKYLYSKLFEEEIIEQGKIVRHKLSHGWFMIDEKEGYYERWKRQMNSPYSKLSEEEKDSDREWAIKLLELLK